MNKCVLKGILRNIEFSHKIGDIEYNKASLVTQEGDIIDLKFKKFSNKYKEGDSIELKGNIRSYSHKTEDGKNKVELYVFTYFDLPESDVLSDDNSNRVELSGRICKINPIHTGENNKQSLHFILANNLIVGDNGRQLNNYIPCICFGSVARKLAEKKVGDSVVCNGFLHSREYKKKLGEDSFEIRVAHEFCVTEIVE